MRACLVRMEAEGMLQRNCIVIVYLGMLWMYVQLYVTMGTVFYIGNFRTQKYAVSKK